MERTLPRDLGGGLTLRRACASDAEALAAFNGDIHRDHAGAEPDYGIVAWTRDLMLGAHPTVRAEDFTVVEEQRSGAIVSSLNLIAQTWTYAGIPFDVGRVELVGTRRDYRGRGLVRVQFEVIHQWSEKRGHLLQDIGGIPWFYRQFGYEMALTLSSMRVGYRQGVPKLAEGQSEPFRVRSATAADADFLAGVYGRAQARYLISCQRNASLWRYEIEGRSADCMARVALYVLETDAGPQGYFAMQPRLRRGSAVVYNFELVPGISWGLAAPAVARFVQAWAEGQGECDSQRWWLGDEHPAYGPLARFLVDRPRPYALYLRVPDLPAFLRHIRPALERRLAASSLAGHSGTMHLGFYRAGMSLTFAGGSIVTVEPWQPQPGDSGDVTFPYLTFIQVLFGYRSLEELEYAFPDCRSQSAEARLLVETLFPKAPSDVWDLG